MSAGYALHSACLGLCLTTILDWRQCVEEAQARSKGAKTS
jgi:hypothetical protein